MSLKPALLSIAVFVIFTSVCAQSSRGFRQELAVTTDNDRYLLQGKDGYYTNGINLRYSRVAGNQGSTLKTINHFEVGQQLYYAYSRKIYQPSEIDRPITGYLYAKFSRSVFLPKQQLFSWGLSVGTIGKAALGEDMQNFFHRLINVNGNWWGWAWKYQLKSELAANAHFSYVRSILPESVQSIRLSPVTQATMGTGFLDISQGLMLQLGRIAPMQESAAWNARLQQDVHAAGATASELYFFIYPQIRYQGYNATVQGGMFRKDKGPFVSSPSRWLYTHEAGALWALSRYTLAAKVVYQSREAVSQRSNQLYGSLNAAFRW